MAIRTYKVTLDSKNSIAPEPVFLRQGDKTGAVVIDATLMDNGTPVSLEGLTPMFKANTADGQAVIADSTGFNIANASGGEFTYQVPNALSAVPGKIMTAYFSFSDASGSESTFDVAFIIKKAVDITKPQADDYITIIDGTLQSLQQKIDAMNTDVQTILNAFNQGDFYNKVQTDSKDAATLTSAKTYADSAIQDTGWITDGITMLNGFLKDVTTPLQYRILTFGPIKMLFVTGWIAGPAMAAHAKVTIAQLPAEPTACVGNVVVGGANIRSATGLFQLNTDGTISLVLYDPVNTLAAGAGTWINIMSVSNK